jgi:hypothetical protein
VAIGLKVWARKRLGPVRRVRETTIARAPIRRRNMTISGMNACHRDPGDHPHRGDLHATQHVLQAGRPGQDAPLWRRRHAGGALDHVRPRLCCVSRKRVSGFAAPGDRAAADPGAAVPVAHAGWQPSAIDTGPRRCPSNSDLAGPKLDKVVSGCSEWSASSKVCFDRLPVEPPSYPVRSVASDERPMPCL